MALAGFFRKFIPDFSRKTVSITKLTKKNEPFSWTQENENARTYVLSCLMLRTDAKSLGYGEILFSDLRVVVYFSQRTDKHQEKYHSYEQKTLAIVNALKHSVFD